MTEQAPNPRAVIGGNAAPIPDQMALAYEQLEADVSAALARARDEMPPAIESDADVALVADWVKQIYKPLVTRLGAAEELEKRPLMNAVDAVRGFFRGKQERLDKGKQVLDKRVKAYQDAERARKAAEAAEAARKLREQEAQQRAAAEAARLEADRKNAELAAAAAKVTGIQAQQAEAQSVAKAAEHVRVKSADGATATAQTFWTHEVLDLAAIPPAMLWPFVSDQAKLAAITAFVKAGNRELPGVRIFEDTRPVYR